MDNIFFVPEDARWSTISAAAHTPEIGTVIDDAMRAIEAENKSLKNVLPKNYASPDLDKRVLGEVVDLFTNMDMSDTEDNKDILGRTYEYCIAQFAAYEGVKGGEFYTPSSVVRTLVEILKPFEDCRVYDKPSKIKKESSYYNAEQLNTLARAAKGTYIETPVILAMVLGLRRSEIVGITWDNIDFDNRLLHIKQSVIVGDSSILPKDTYKIIGHTKSRKSKDIILKSFLKTESSERSFILNDALYEYLKTLKAEQDSMIRETNAYKDFLCVNAVGTLITPDSITEVIY